MKVGATEGLEECSTAITGGATNKLLTLTLIPLKDGLNLMINKANLPLAIADFSVVDIIATTAVALLLLPRPLDTCSNINSRVNGNLILEF